MIFKWSWEIIIYFLCYYLSYHELPEHILAVLLKARAGLILFVVVTGEALLGFFSSMYKHN